MATITTLIEDSGTEHLSLQIEHGLSFFIETEESSFIFDCGATDKFIINAARLDIDLGRAELVVCSHSHYDHAGGYPDLIKKFEIKRFITGNSFFEPKFACENEKYTYLGSGFGPWLLKKHNINHEICGDLIQISNDCWIVGNFKRIHDIETIPARFVRQKGNEFINDDFPDEICLAIEGKDGLAVVLGCSHPGVLNMLETIQERLNKPITSVWGGSHLMEADDGRIAYTISKMKRMGIRRMGFSHCSGSKVAKYCADDPDIIYSGLSTGDSVKI